MRLRTTVMLASVVVFGLQAAVQPAVAAAVVPFRADSGDQCRRGVAHGTLDWFEGPAIKPIVNVEGILSDDAPFSSCRDDGMYSAVTIAAFNGKTRIDSSTSKADNEQVKIAVALSDPNGVARIDRVVVQVCRFSTSPIGISYCGTAQEYPGR